MRTNKKRFCRALAAFPLTHGASLLLPGAANIAVAAGDIFMAASDATGVWWVLD